MTPEIVQHPSIYLAGCAKWKEFATSGYHSCAITHTGALLCWGVNEYGQAGNTLYPNQEEPGRYEPTLVPTQVTEERNWTSVSVSMTHTCATKSDGTLWCWGLNKLNSDTYSRLGLNSVIEHYSNRKFLLDKDGSRLPLVKIIRAAVTILFGAGKRISFSTTNLVSIKRPTRRYSSNRHR